MALRAGVRIGLVAAAAVILTGCAETQLAVHMTKRLENAADGTPSNSHGTYKIGKPYRVDGALYRPHEDFFYDETGIASWYGPGFHGNHTANGDRFDQNALTAAHPTLQLPAKVRVTNLENGRSVAVIVNDRGPYHRGRIIDLSRRAAQLLGFAAQGTARVRVQSLPEESYELAVLAGRKGPPPVRLARARQAPLRAPVTVAALPAVASAQPASAPTSEPAVTAGPVHPTAIYVQAGAFSHYDNADRLRARLAAVGRAAITPVEVGSRRLWRVRIGPLASVADADKALDRVVGLGIPEARLVVD